MAEDGDVRGEDVGDGGRMGRPGSIWCTGKTKTTAADLLDVFPREGGDGGHGNDDDERSHRIEPELNFEKKRRGAKRDREGIGRAHARVSVGRIYRPRGGTWRPSMAMAAWMLATSCLCP